MGADQNIDWRDAAASALDWWHDAGVDVLVEDTPRDWLSAPVTVAAPIARALTPAPTQPAAMPNTLEAFVAWRIGADAPEAAWSGVSIAASGPANAHVMVLVDCPERDDGDAGALLSGAAGRLFDRMLAAIGLSRDTVQLTAVCARRPSAGRIAAEMEARLAEIAQHHVSLVAPKRLLLLGNAASRAILGMDHAAARGSLRSFNHRSGDTGVVASFHPRFLLEKPAAKAEAWKDLQMLIGGMGE